MLTEKNIVLYNAYLPIYGLLSDAINSSDYTATNEMMNTELERM
jgi:hypothetical protein